VRSAGVESGKGESDDDDEGLTCLSRRSRNGEGGTYGAISSNTCVSLRDSRERSILQRSHCATLRRGRSIWITR
jgi:hypothetical protein